MINRVFIVLVGWVLLTLLEQQYPGYWSHGRADWWAGFLLAWALFKPLPKRDTHWEIQ